MATYGDLAIAGVGVTLKITMITSLISMGFGLGIQPVFGYLIGAKDEERFKASLKFSLVFALGLSSDLTGICYLALDGIVGSFLSDKEAYNYAVSFSKVMLSSQFLVGMFFVRTFCLVFLWSIK